MARVYGRLLARIAQTEADSFRVYVQPRLRATGADRGAGMRAVQKAFAKLLPLADPLLLGTHRRWLEYELTQAAVTEVQAATPGELPGAVEIAVLFVDLKDFTAYADTTATRLPSPRSTGSPPPSSTSGARSGSRSHSEMA